MLVPGVNPTVPTRYVDVPAPAGARSTVLRLRDAANAGVSLGRLRSQTWQSLSFNLHGLRGERSTTETATALSLILPRNSGFGHLTSAALRGWWMPNQLGGPFWLATTLSPVHVQRRGLYVRRSRRATFETIDGVTCVTADHTLVELARDLTLIDLVPMVDCALRLGTTEQDILAAASGGSRGCLTLRKAVAFADSRSESWWESVLRLQHTTTGLGPVACQVELHDEGRFVARTDLHLVGTRRYPECDGGDHRDREQHLRDLRRDKDMHRLGAERFGYTTAEIARSPATVIRDAEDARGLAHDADRVAEWRHLAQQSTLTGHGRARLLARLRRYRLAAERRGPRSG